MSVLIKGMEMPRTCSDCEWSYYVGNGRAMCKRVSMTDKTDIMTKRRADFCPLIEVPTPHGRLIDGDALINELASEHVGGLEAIKTYTGADTWTSGLHTAWRTIDDADTVIEAEEYGK